MKRVITIVVKVILWSKWNQTWHKWYLDGPQPYLWFWNSDHMTVRPIMLSEISKIFFLETTYLMEPLLGMNVPFMTL